VHEIKHRTSLLDRFDNVLERLTGFAVVEERRALQGDERASVNFRKPPIA